MGERDRLLVGNEEGAGADGEPDLHADGRVGGSRRSQGDAARVDAGRDIAWPDTDLELSPEPKVSVEGCTARGAPLLATVNFRVGSGAVPVWY
jgi:hypothetical protein